MRTLRRRVTSPLVPPDPTRLRRPRPWRVGSVAGALAFLCAAAQLAADVPPFPAPKQPPPVGRAHSVSTPPARTLTDAEQREFAGRFKREVWPLLAREQGGCVACHDAKNVSPLRFFPDAEGSFAMLLAEQRFDAGHPASLVARVTSGKAGLRMPPAPHPRWSAAEVAALREFGSDLHVLTGSGGKRIDEEFPAALRLPYRGEAPASGPDNTFVSFRQLKEKVRVIFGDDWRRDDRDLFQDNLALFGGADFVQRFDESTRASPSFLTGVDMLARDVASRAYLNGSGPFRGLPQDLPSPLGMKAPDARTRQAIGQLYRRVLYRNPTPAELAGAFRFMQGVYRAERRLGATGQDLRFELTVKDDRGLATTQNLTVPVTDEPYGLYQEFIDQNPRSAPSSDSGPSAEREREREREGEQSGASSGSMGKAVLGQRFTLKAGDAGQRFSITNRNTSGNVSIAGLELRGPLPSTGVKELRVTDAGARAEGAWRLVDQDGTASYEDGNDNKGKSSVILPLRVDRSGSYELTVLWRRNDGVPPPDRRGRRRAPVANASEVLVEVRSHDRHHLALPAPPPVPPPGEAHFIVDQSIDNLAFWDLKTAFRFGEQDGVEIHNGGTKRRVVADAVKFAPVGEGPALLLDEDEADGREAWTLFRDQNFRPYNTTGRTTITDDNQKKGELRVRYRPARKPEWQADGFYRVFCGFPGKADNETRAPVVVHARESSPILQLVHPQRAQVGAPVVLDASRTYNLQRTALRFQWRQMGGPRVALKDPTAARLSFTAPAMTARQAAWEGLCRALVRHPDFLFTRPRSLAQVTDPADRRRLHLVKIAQDLVGRTPTDAEVQRLEKGTSLATLVDGYLASREFRDFYFHRIRLTLESHGSEVQDEPVRLWCYVAFNDRPFKEILTADYTVDAQLRKQPRPANHGKTGLLTMKGFLEGKPGLPHFNYAALVTEKFLGTVYEVPPEVVMMREGITAISTTSPDGLCYSCHKILTPLAFQRLNWTDEGEFRTKDEQGAPIDASDRGLVPSYPFKGNGMEAFALQAQNKEAFIRTMIQTHFVMFSGRELRYREDERGLYKRLWDRLKADGYTIRGLIRGIVLSREYLSG